MNSYDIISLIVSAVGVISFAAIFTILYLNYANSTVGEFASGKRDVELIEDTIYQNISKGKLHRRIWDRAKQVVFIACAVILIPFLVISIVSKFQNGVVMLFDRGVIAVASGSMSEKHKDNTYLQNIDNQIPTYDLIVLEKVHSASEIQKYDVIAYVNDEGTNIIHRIVKIEYTESGPVYTTRGDSNNADDTYKPTFDDIIGRYTNEGIPFVGLFAMFLQSYSGIVTIAAVIYCLIMIEAVGEKIFKSQQKRLEVLDESLDFKRETVFDEKLNASFVETVYYKEYIYVFDKNGFVSKSINPDYHPDGDRADTEKNSTLFTDSE